MRKCVEKENFRLGALVFYSVWLVPSAQDLGTYRQEFLCCVLDGQIGKQRLLLLCPDWNFSRALRFGNRNLSQNQEEWILVAVDLLIRRDLFAF